MLEMWHLKRVIHKKKAVSNQVHGDPTLSVLLTSNEILPLPLTAFH